MILNQRQWFILRPLKWGCLTTRWEMEPFCNRGGNSAVFTSTYWIINLHPCHYLGIFAINPIEKSSEAWMGTMKMYSSDHITGITPTFLSEPNKGEAVWISEYKQETFVQCSFQLWSWSWAWPPPAMAINHPKNRCLSPFVGVQLLCATLDQTWLFLCCCQDCNLFLAREAGAQWECHRWQLWEWLLGSLSSNPQHFSSLQQRCPLPSATKKKRVFLNYGWKVFGCSGLFVIGLSDLTHLIKNYWRTSCFIHTLPQFLTVSGWAVVQSYKTTWESNNWPCLQTKVSY